MPRLVLTDFVAVDTLQEIQDAFASVTRLTTVIVDAAEQPVTTPTDAARRLAADQVLGHLLDDVEDADHPGRFMAPISVAGQTLGLIVIRDEANAETMEGLDPKRLAALAEVLELAPDELSRLSDSARVALAANRAAAVRFLYLIANAIARLCYEQYEAKQRVEELSALYQVSTALSSARALQQVLDTAVRSAAEVMRVDAAVVRLLEDGADGPELRRRANHGLSESYINHGRLIVNRSEILKKAFAGEAVFIEDLASDPRTYYPELAKQEGLASMLALGLVDQGLPLGALILYTVHTRRFSKQQVQLARAIAQLVAAAISKHRLEGERQKSQSMMRQLSLAADVQRRMLPSKTPDLQGFDIAARYVPSYQLSGDFYDFVRLGEGNFGFAIGDVAGKGIAASLLMASVRASLRAYAHDQFHIDQIIALVNRALCRDTLDQEFATLWYGTIDPRNKRLTYCNAGHEPPMLLRDGKLTMLYAGGMIVGVDREAVYDKGIMDLYPGDVLLLYTDGLPDSMNADDKRFSRASVEAALLGFKDKPAATAQEILNHLLTKLRQHTGPRRNTDDTTLVCIKVERS
jgi:sigma-B regulation protein RsbU (phosphoserine phosphatase)